MVGLLITYSLHDTRLLRQREHAHRALLSVYLYGDIIILRSVNAQEEESEEWMCSDAMAHGRVPIRIFNSVGVYTYSEHVQ